MSKRHSMKVEYQVWSHIDMIIKLSRSQYQSMKSSPNFFFLTISTTNILISRPTIDSRKELFAAAKRKAEDIRVQIRKHHAASLKRGGYAKHSIELEEVFYWLELYLFGFDPKLSCFSLVPETLRSTCQGRGQDSRRFAENYRFEIGRQWRIS